MKIDKIIKSSLFVLAVMLALNPEAAFTEKTDSDKAPNDLFFYLSPTLLYRTDSFYPAGETTSLPDFRLFYEYEAIPLFAEIGWQNRIGNLSTWFSLPIRRSCVAAGEQSLGTNLPYQGMDIDTTFPFKGYLAWENDYLGLKLARDKIDIGPGYWSSVELNKQNPYWDHFNFYYKVGNFRLEHYIIRLNPFLVTAEERSAQDSMTGYNVWDPEAYSERVKNIVVHEFTWFIGDSFILAVGEFLLVGGRSLQLSDLNPMLVFHNFYGEDWGNVYGFLNLQYRPHPGFKSYIDIVIDDVVSTVESGVENTCPAALGVMIGFQAELFKGSKLNLFWVAEGSYVFPTFGIRSQPLQTFYSRMFYIDNTVGGKRLYVDYPVGYYLGNDLIDFRTALIAKIMEKCELSVDYHLLFKGEESLHSDPADEGSAIHVGYLPRGIVEIMNEIRIECKLRMNRRHSVALNGRLTFLQNKDHIEGARAIDFGVGATLTSIIF